MPKRNLKSRIASTLALLSLLTLGGCSSCGAPTDSDPEGQMGNAEAMQEEMAEEVIEDSDR